MGIQINYKKKEVWQTSRAGEETEAHGGKEQSRKGRREPDTSASSLLLCPCSSCPCSQWVSLAGLFVIHQVLPRALMSQQALCWTLHSPGHTDEPGLCLKWGTRLLSSSLAQGFSIHLYTGIIAVVSAANQHFSSFFYAPAQTMIKEPPTSLHFLPLPWYTICPKKGLAIAVWFIAQKAFRFQKLEVKARCSYFTF